ncbi:glycoside hydrolase [Tricholoma matsutake]|nr:glycoside hydrolase [Tricholoma matsutake 945]
MHYTLVLHIFTFFTIAHAYPIPRWSRTSSGENLQLVKMRQVVSSAVIPSSSISTPVISSAPAASGALQKYVVAHHMVGNTYPYTLQDWADDIALAHSSGIDGFALNMGKEQWEPARVADGYTAALQSGLGFKMFLSLDMSSMPCASSIDAQTLRNLVNTYVSHPNQLQYQSRAFVSTFSGETCTFGQGSVLDGWKNEFSMHPDLQGKIYFVPSFFIDPAKFGDFTTVMDGDFNWNSAWPIQVTTSFAQNLLNSAPFLPSPPSIIPNVASDVNRVLSGLASIQNALNGLIGSTDTDKTHLAGLSSLSSLSKGVTTRNQAVYMAAVSPWFFTHYGQDSFNKNFIYLSDQHLYSKRWESLIAMRDQVDIVQILTWNDYGESHYVGPIKGAQPNSQAWVDGMNHTAWLELTAYYAMAFKTGQTPSIVKDKIVMWSRTHPSQATAPDPVGRPDNFELSEDAVWAVVMTTAPSTVRLSTSSTNSKTYNVSAGLTKLSVPINAGDTMKGTIQRNGQTIVELNPPEFTFRGSPQSYNFNAFVASATAP